MAKKNTPSAPCAFQLRFEAGLRLGALALALFHLMMSFYRHYSDFSDSPFYPLEYAAAILLALAAVVYLLIVRFRFPQTRGRAKAYLRQLCCPEFLLLAALFIWYLICCVAVGSHYRGNWLRGNLEPLLDVAVSVFLLFPLSFSLLQKYRVRVLHALIHALTFVTTAIALFALVNVFTLNVVDTPAGQIGMTAGVRLNISSNPNTGAAYISAVSMLGLYMLIVQPPIVKAAYAVSLFIQLTALMLSNSRTCFVALAAGFALCAFMLVWHGAAKRSAVQRIAAGVLAAALVVVALSCFRAAVFDVFESVTHFSQYVKTTRQDRALTLSDTHMSARYRIWKAAFAAMTESAHRMLFGVTPISVPDAIELASGGRYVGYYTHNQFLEVGVCLGFPGLLLYLAYLVLIARNCLKIGLSGQHTPHFGFFILPITILMLVIANLPEGRLLFYYYLPGSVFFLVCGLVTLESRNYPPLAFPAGKRRRGK